VTKRPTKCSIENNVHFTLDFSEAFDHAEPPTYTFSFTEAFDHAEPQYYNWSFNEPFDA